jgi:enterochelin esterase-like enzyme
MFIEELIPYMEKTYRLKKSKKYRFIGGLSMGGFGSLGYSMRHPELFSSCISYSAAIRPDDEILAVPQADFDELYEPVYGKGVVGKARLSKHWNENNPIFLADKIPAEKLRSVNWYITVGDDDWLYYGNSVLNNIFRLKKVPREYRVYDGKHNWVYWRGHIGEGLRFITKYLREEE